MQGKQVIFDRQPIPFSSMPLHMLTDGEYIRLLGKHALPHVFHKQDLRKLMALCRGAVAPIFMGTLPAHCPVHMYNAVAGGIQRWSSAVRPPLPRAMRLANLPVAPSSENFGISLLIPPLNFFYSPWHLVGPVCVEPCQLWYCHSCPPTNAS